MNLALRAGCLAIYALALAGLAGWLTGTPATVFEYLAALLLVVHAIEIAAMFRYVRLHQPLAASIVLTLLFGLLHWKPLADAQAKSA